jgi:hypothetical protein
MYYVISGGLSVYLDRSHDLSKWEGSKQKGIVLQTSVNDTEVCTKYIGYKPRDSEKALLASAKAAFPGSCSWDCDASDVDLWEMGDGTVSEWLRCTHAFRSVVSFGSVAKRRCRRWR